MQPVIIGKDCGKNQHKNIIPSTVNMKKKNQMQTNVFNQPCQCTKRKIEK